MQLALLFLLFSLSRSRLLSLPPSRAVCDYAKGTARVLPASKGKTSRARREQRFEQDQNLSRFGRRAESDRADLSRRPCARHTFAQERGLLPSGRARRSVRSCACTSRVAPGPCGSSSDSSSASSSYEHWRARMQCTLAHALRNASPAEPPFCLAPRLVWLPLPLPLPQLRLRSRGSDCTCSLASERRRARMKMREKGARMTRATALTLVRTRKLFLGEQVARRALQSHQTPIPDRAAAS